MSERLFRALEFAVRAHGGQFRKGTRVPYIVHPMAVARMLAEEGADEDIVIAGLLHDTIEDTGATAPEIEREFGDRVARLVEAESEPVRTARWETRKSGTLERLRDAPDDVRLIALADKLDNLRSIARDLKRQGEEVWTRFSRGRESQADYFRGLAGVFGERGVAAAPHLVAEFRALVEEVFA